MYALLKSPAPMEPPPPPKPPLAWWGVWADPGGAPQTEPCPEGGDDPVGEFREPALTPHCLQLLKLRVGRTDGSGLLRRCRLSQASCDEEGDEDRLLELEGLHYSDVEVGYKSPFLLEGWVQVDLLDVD